MHLPRDARFDDEAARFALVFTCEECGHFDRARDACSHEWPTALHRLATVDPERSGEAAESKGRELVFCKEFEAR